MPRPLRTTAVLVAGGSGERLGAGVPKALVHLDGRPLLLHAALALARAETVTDTVVVVPENADEDLVADVRRLLSDGGCADIVLARGGATRPQSVVRGLAAAPGDGDDIVAVHDAARPLVSPALIDRTVRSLVPPWDAVAPGLPVTDTVKQVEGGDAEVVRTVDRRPLWTVQTPQVFRRRVLEAAHARSGVLHERATDDLGMVEGAGGRVRLVAGERRNLKITVAEDLELAAAIVRGLRP